MTNAINSIYNADIYKTKFDQYGQPQKADTNIADIFNNAGINSIFGNKAAKAATVNQPANQANNQAVQPQDQAVQQNKVAAPEDAQLQQENATSLKGLQAAESTNNNEKQFDSVAQKLTAAGYDAKVVESDKTNAAGTTLAGEKTKYLEITDKDGKVTKIWDANGNGTIEAADFNTNTYLKEFANDLKAQKADIAGDVKFDAEVATANNEEAKDAENKDAEEKLAEANDAGGGNQENNNVENNNVENNNKEAAVQENNAVNANNEEVDPTKVANQNENEQVADNNQVQNQVNPLVQNNATEETEKNPVADATKADIADVKDKDTLIQKYMLQGYQRAEAEKLAEAEIYNTQQQ